MDYGRIFDEGSAAAHAGQPETACPYTTDGSSRRAWLAGFAFQLDTIREHWTAQGRAAFAAGEPRDLIPHPMDPLSAGAWLAGYDAAQAEAAPRDGIRRIDLTPTWAGLIPALVALIENGTAEGRATAIQELRRLAEGMDAANAAQKGGAQ